jgi:hypothetical protein
VPASKDTLFYSPTKQPLEEGWLEFKKISEDDYRRLVKDFISSLPPDQYSQANNIVMGQSFAKPWTQFLHEHCGAEKFKDWESKRVAWVFDSLATRLNEAGVSDHTRTRLIELLKTSRDALRSPHRNKMFSVHHSDSRTKSLSATTPSVNRSKQSLTVGQVDNTDINHVRDTLHRAIDQMSLEELRALRIPVGLLIDLMHSQ